MTRKYEPATLPTTMDDALTMAVEREEWAKFARSRDHLGTVRELELTALLLRFYASSLEAIKTRGAKKS